MSKNDLTAIDAHEAPLLSKSSVYPPIPASRVKGGENRPLIRTTTSRPALSTAPGCYPEKMALHTDHPRPGETGEAASGPRSAVDTGNEERPVVTRTATGAIDIEHYERRASELRSRFVWLCLRKLARRISQFWRRRSAEAELNALDDRTLYDIGITRCDIPSIVSGVFARDASRRQRRPSPGIPGSDSRN